ncbi:MAG: carbohydrate ABC transporter permease [Alphaproteobacteria bacterium]
MADAIPAKALLDRRIAGSSLTFRDLPIWLIGMAVVLIWAAPFVWMVSTSLKPVSEVMTREIEWLPRTVVWDNYLKVLDYPVVRWAINSVIVSVTATALCVVFGALAGYALARLRFPGRDTIFLIFLASIMVPAEITFVPMLIAMINVGWANSYQALILPTVANVFSVYIFRQFFLTFPSELEDAAIVDGAGRFQIFWRIAFPLARAPTIAATVIIFTLNWNNFLWPLLVTFEENMKTLAVGIAVFAPVVGSNTQLDTFGIGMAGVTLLSIPSLALFLFLQRYFIQGITSGSLKS